MRRASKPPGVQEPRKLGHARWIGKRDVFMEAMREGDGREAVHALAKQSKSRWSMSTWKAEQFL